MQLLLRLEVEDRLPSLMEVSLGDLMRDKPWSTWRREDQEYSQGSDQPKLHMQILWVVGERAELIGRIQRSLNSLKLAGI